MACRRNFIVTFSAGCGRNLLNVKASAWLGIKTIINQGAGFVFSKRHFSSIRGLGLIHGSYHFVQSHAYVLNNMQSVFIILFSAIMCKPPSHLQLAGLACVIVGFAAMILDPLAVRTDGVSGGLLNYTVEFCSSAFCALYFIVNGQNL